MPRAPSIKVADGTKDGRRTFTVTYHAEGPRPAVQIEAVVYRDNFGDPALHPTKPVPGVSLSPHDWQVLAALATVDVDITDALAINTEETGDTASVCAFTMYTARACLTWQGIKGTATYRHRAPSVDAFRELLDEDALIETAAVDLHRRVCRILAGARQLAETETTIPAT